MTSADHIIKSYDEELASLTDNLRRMGDMARLQFLHALDALHQRDADAARRIINADDAIDDLEHAIGEDVVRLLALRAPMAGDLRRIFAALRVAGDLERIGDCATGVARRVPLLPATVPDAFLRALERLGIRAAGAVDGVLDAWARGDADLARRVWRGDRELDDAYTSVFRELLTYMMEDPRQIGACTQLLFMAKNIERIGDHATNIAESTWFAATGGRLTAAVAGEGSPAS